jgi:hypothetical protein
VRNVESRGRVRRLSALEDRADLDFVNVYDWESDMKLWEEQKSKSCVVNPITSMFGQITNCPGLSIIFNGPVN